MTYLVNSHINMLDFFHPTIYFTHYPGKWLQFLKLEMILSLENSRTPYIGLPFGVTNRRWPGRHYFWKYPCAMGNCSPSWPRVRFHVCRLHCTKELQCRSTLRTFTTWGKSETMSFLRPFKETISWMKTTCFLLVGFNTNINIHINIYIYAVFEEHVLHYVLNRVVNIKHNILP